MPSSKKQASKRSVKTFKIPEEFFHGIENAEGWNATVEFLCGYLKLPDLSTRSGLKKVHARFTEVFKALDDIYTHSNGNDKIMGGIVGIWAKMSSDALLRDKLFKAGLVSKMTLLLDIPSTRHIVLQSLVSVTHHGGVEARRQIATLAPKLVKLMQDFPDDPKIIELATVTMSHSICAVLGQEEDPNPQTLASLQIRSVLHVVIDNLCKLSVTDMMVSHAIPLLTSVTLHCSKECRAVPPLVTFLVACLRSKDISIRCNAIGGLIRLNFKDAEPDTVFYDPQKMMLAAQRRFPDDLVDVMMNYGVYKCDTAVTLRSTVDYQKVMMGCAQDHDLYSLGKKLAELILRTEFSIAEGGFQVMNERTGELELMDIGLPFKMWTDALPHCAHALRAMGKPADLDDADILELKHKVIKQRLGEAVQLAKKAIERNPQLAYAYYVIGLGVDTEQGLRSVKKGLKCKHITPFVRNYMLWRATEHAGNLGIIRLQEAGTGDRDYAEGLAFLTSSQEDAKTFISQAPPDTRNLQTVLNWYIICTIALRGPELSTDLRELDDAFKKLKLTNKFAAHLGYPPKRTLMRMTREVIVDNYAAAVKMWGAAVERFDGMDFDENSHRARLSHVEDDLVAWLDDLHIDDDDYGHDDESRRCAHPKVGATPVELYRCSFCGNPSAVLRKCGGCGKMRYCDAGCQRSHWGDHKRVCKTT